MEESQGRSREVRTSTFGGEGSQHKLDLKAERKVTPRAKVGDWWGPKYPWA